MSCPFRTPRGDHLKGDQLDPSSEPLRFASNKGIPVSNDPLDTTDYRVPTDPSEVAQALREMADGEDDYLGRLLMVAAHHIEAFANEPSSRSSHHLDGAKKLGKITPSTSS